MHYAVEIRRNALRDLKPLAKPEARWILYKIRGLENNLEGDVKRLTNFTPEYRLRVGKWRVLFDIEGDRVVVHRVKHRREAYSRGTHRRI